MGDRICRQLMARRGHGGGMMCHAEPAILGDVQLGRESLSTRSQQGPSQGSRGQARVS